MQTKPRREIVKCRRFMHDRIEPLIECTVAHCHVSLFRNSGEPESAESFLARAEAGAVTFEQGKFGQPWGSTWGTTWFKVEGHIPVDSMNSDKPLELVADLGWSDTFVGGQGEGLVYAPDGRILKGLNPKNKWVRLTGEGAQEKLIDSDGNFLVYIEAGYNPQLDSLPARSTDLGYGPTGRPDVWYPLRRMDVCEFDTEHWNYYLDLDVISGLIEELDPESVRYWELIKALQRSLNVYDSTHPDTVCDARKALAEVLSKEANASTLHEYAVGHAHIDSAWLWPKRETRRKVARTVSNALALMDINPRFIHAMSSAQQYAWLEEDHPDLFRRMLERVKTGNFVPVGGMWVECDSVMPTGESLVRQILVGRRYFRDHLGIEPRGIWLPDSFGYNGAFPQIARRAGYDWFMTEKIVWNDTTKVPHHSFMWTGIDGTEIFTHFPPANTYSAEMKLNEIKRAERNFADKGISDKALLLYGYGDGGGGATREMTGKLERLNNLEGSPTVQYAHPDEFFDDALAQIKERAGDEIPRWKGELYLEMHRATLTSQQAMKRGCRREEALLRTCEYLSTVAALANNNWSYPADELDDLWKVLLFNQFHDILPGSSISWVHREAREDYAKAEKKLLEIIDDANRAIVASGEANKRFDCGVLVPRKWGNSPAWKPEGIDSRNDMHASNVVSLEKTSDGIVLENGLIRLSVGSDGIVTSLVDLEYGRELVAEGEGLAGYDLLINQPSEYDAWEIERDALLTPRERGRCESIKIFANDDGSVAVHVVTALGEASRAETRIVLEPGAKRVDFSADVDWHEEERFLKVEYPLDLDANEATYECPYGTVSRPIEKTFHGDETKFESCTHRFMHIADSGYGVGIANGSMYGASVFPLRPNGFGGVSRGVCVGISLLNAPVYPDPDTDRGMHHFDWSLCLDASVADTLHCAERINAPKIDGLAECEPLATVECDEGEVVLDWVKMADDGSGDVILRLYEPVGARAQGNLRLSNLLANSTVIETDLLERDALVKELPRALKSSGPAQGALLVFRPYQIATLRLHR